MREPARGWQACRKGQGGRRTFDREDSRVKTQCGQGTRKRATCASGGVGKGLSPMSLQEGQEEEDITVM
jgi:hypothetical protein